MADIKKKIDWKSIQVIVAGFLLLFLIFDSEYFLYTAIGVSVLTLVVPVSARLILFIWEKIGLILGTINSKIILSLVFFLFLVPFALLYRLFTKKASLDKQSTTFQTRDKLYTSSDLENMW